MADTHEEVAGGEADATQEFQPLVTLQEVKVESGEEHEDVLWKQRCKLYRFYIPTKEWKERGIGDVKFLCHKDTKRIRLLLRQDKTFKVVMNHHVDHHPNANLKANAGSDTSWVWTAKDYSEGQVKAETFAIRFKTPEIAEQFKAEYEKAQKTNASIPAGAQENKQKSPAKKSPAKKSPAKPAETKEEPKKEEPKKEEEKPAEPEAKKD